jgi:hypothetical protein
MIKDLKLNPKESLMGHSVDVLFDVELLKSEIKDADKLNKDEIINNLSSICNKLEDLIKEINYFPS